MNRRAMVRIAAWLAAGVGIILLFVGLSRRDESVPPSRAAHYVGESTTVCGEVVDTKFAAEASGRPTFLNFGEPYPRQKFVVVIWGSERPGFERPPESFYLHKRVCISGRIELYEGVPRMVVRDPQELRLVRPGIDGERLNLALAIVGVLLALPSFVLAVQDVVHRMRDHRWFGRERTPPEPPPVAEP